MSNLTSSAAWKAIGAVGGPVDLRKYTKIKPEVAKQLCCDEDLDLSGLKELTPALAEVFKAHRGGLILDGLQTLSLDAARHLKDFKGSLSFEQIETLDDEVAMLLSQREAGDGSWKYWPKSIFGKISRYEDTPGHLAFFGKLIKNASSYDCKAKEFTPTQAQIIVDGGDDIAYSNIETLTKETAAVFSKTNKKISFSGIKELSPEVVEALCGHENLLTLSGLEYVCEELAVALSKHKGKISVGGIKEMPDRPGYIALAEKLAKENPESITIYAKSFGPKIAKIFCQCQKVNLNGIEDLENTPEHLELFTKVCSVGPDDSISLYSLKNIPDPLLEVLAASTGKVDFTGPTKWSEGAGHIAWAKRLANSKPSGGFYSVFNNAEFFPNKIAEIFSNSNVELNSIREFDSSPGNIALAKKIAEGSKYINIKKISPEVCEILVNGKNTNYTFSDLEEIDTKSFKLLFSTKDSIFLTKIKEINQEIAKMTEGEKSLGFDGLKSITQEIAESFGNGKGTLYLRGLESIEDKCLEALVKREGGDLHLDGLKSLNDAQAKILSTSKSNLYLCGLESLADNTLNLLLDLDSSKSISLPKLREINNENALKMGSREGNIDLSGLERLEDCLGHIALAEKMAKNWRIELTNLINLSPIVAEKLATKSTVRIKGLKEINSQTAKALSSVSENLELTDLCIINKEVAESLKDFKGNLSIGNIDNIDDDTFELLTSNKQKMSLKVNKLTPKKASALAKINNLYISDLKTIDFESAKCFKGYKGEMYLADLCSLDADAAGELRKLKRRLSTGKAGEWALATGL